jgi:hypothetical protein
MTQAEAAIAALPAAARSSLPDRLAAVFESSIAQLRAAGAAVDARASLSALVAEIARSAAAAALNPFSARPSRSESEWIERPIFVVAGAPPRSFSDVLASVRAAASSAVAAVVSPAGARTVPVSPALLSALARRTTPDLTATRAALSRVPASVSNFAEAVRRAREVQDAEKRARLVKWGAVGAAVVLAVVYLRRRKGGR